MKGTPENQETCSPADEAIGEYVDALLEDPKSTPSKREKILRDFPELAGAMDTVDQVRSEVLKDKPFLDQKGEEAKERGSEGFKEAVEERIKEMKELELELKSRSEEFRNAYNEFLELLDEDVIEAQYQMEAFLAKVPENEREALEDRLNSARSGVGYPKSEEILAELEPMVGESVAKDEPLSAKEVEALVDRVSGLSNRRRLREEGSENSS